MFVNPDLISEDVAKKISLALVKSGGLVPENKVVIFSSKEDTKLGSIIIPGESENIPKKGVVVQCTELTEEYKTYTDLVKVGRILTYGLYAGKEVQFSPELFTDIPNNIISKGKFTVLSINEIAYSESNN